MIPQKINCIYCKSNDIIKKGKLYNKKITKQIYFCKNCNKKFTLSKLKHKIYSPKIILQAISYYNLSNTLGQTSKLINKQFKIKVSKSTINNWLKEFSGIYTYHKIKDKIAKSSELIKEKLFKHRGLTYNYKYHKGKLNLFYSNKNLVNYLKNLENNFPHKFFEEDQRCSELKLFNNSNFKIKNKYNYACKLAGLSLKAVNTSEERHRVIENFMLINDSATIAIEVPVWFWERRVENGIGICGHIDILQSRGNKIYILDYKPDAAKENLQKVSSQLYLYALALSFRSKIPLKGFRCAWFDDKNYFEFNPTEIRSNRLCPKTHS